MLSRYIYHPAVQTIKDEILDLINVPRPRNLPRCQFFLGPPGVGKTELLNDIFDDPAFEPSEGPTGLVQPIIRVDAPNEGSIKSLTEALLRALQDPHPTRGTLPEMTARLYRQLRGQLTRMVVIDEVHQLTRIDRYRYAEFLKDLFNGSDCPLLCVGLADALELPRANKQLARRCLVPLQLPPFDWFNPTEQRIFRSILSSMRQADLDRLAKLPIEQPPLAPAIHLASGGTLGNVVQLLDAGFRFAARSGRVAAEIGDLANAFQHLDQVWDSRPRFNPFTVEQLPSKWSAMPFDAGSKRK